MKSRALVLAMVFAWQMGYAQPHVKAEGTNTKTVTALRNTGATSVLFRSLGVQVTPNSGRPKKYVLRMLYDPKTRLCYWEALERYPGYAPEGDANLTLGNATIYIAPDRIALFRIAMGGLLISESEERQSSLDEAQKNAMRSLDKRALSQQLRTKRVDYLKQIPNPGDFLKQCITDIDMPHIQTIQRRGHQWEVKVAAQNGNEAVLSLDKSDNLISSKVILNPNADFASGCKGPSSLRQHE